MKERGLLCDRDGNRWLTFVNAVPKFGAISADIEQLHIPEEALKVFREHEERVSRQEFSFADELENRIDGFGLSVIWDGEEDPMPLYDVQVMGRKVSFRLQRP